jgi:hypothetical protein
VVTGPYERSEGCFSLGTGVAVEAEAPDAVVDEAADVVDVVDPHRLHVPRSRLLEHLAAACQQGSSRRGGDRRVRGY